MTFTKTRFNEDEIKEILETLFLEKKLVKELQQRLGESQKEIEFLRKTSDSHFLEELSDKAKEMALADQDQKVKNEMLLADLKENSTYIGYLQKELAEIKGILRLAEEEKKQEIDKFNALYVEKENLSLKLHEIEYQIKSDSELYSDLESVLDRERKRLKAFKDEKELIQKQLAESQFHSEQLEKGIQYLRSRLEDAKIDKELLGEELLELQESLKASQAQHQELITRFEEFQKETKQGVVEKDFLKDDLQAVQGQFEQLKESIKQLKLESEEQLSSINQLEKSNQKLQEDKLQLRLLLDQKEAKFEIVEKETLSLKENVLQGMRHLKEVEREYSTLIVEKEKTQQALLMEQEKVGQLQEHLRISEMKQRQESIAKDILDEEISKYKEIEKEKIELQELYLKLEQKFQEKSHLVEEGVRIKSDFDQKLQKLHEALNDKDRTLESRTGQLAVLNQEKHKLQEMIHNVQLLADEKESQVKLAQQHLAKKMKETASLHEKLEEQKIQILEMQNQFNGSQTKMAELRSLLETKQQQEKRLEEMLNESMKSSSRWEEKYFGIADKVQEMEMRYKELKKIEEKYLHLQAVLSNLGNTFDSPVHKTQSEPANHAIPQEIKSPERPASPKKEVSEERQQEKNPGDLFTMPQNTPKPKQTFFDS